jgi:16S rRNA (guanine527-N7)-methyltransferase
VTAAEDALHAVLVEARQQGFLGSPPVEAQIEHARGFVEVVAAKFGSAGPPRLVDLGSGGGVPGLVLASAWPACNVTLIESAQRRSAFLAAAVERLGIAPRVEVIPRRAEEVAREAARRETFDVTTARSLAPPAVTAELAAPFVRVGGVVVVSEPPAGHPQRWDEGGLVALGLRITEVVEASGGHFAVLEKRATTDERFPRAVGRAAKRPLW